MESQPPKRSKQDKDGSLCNQSHPKEKHEGLKEMLEQHKQKKLIELENYNRNSSIPSTDQPCVSNAVTAPERFGKGVSPLIIDQVRSLPIYPMKDKLMEQIKKSQVVVVKGETGSGKSTQIPKYLVAAGYTANSKVIAVTQPRRVAAKSLAERVARETGTDMGDLVGYAVRFDKCTSQNTIIKYVTDGLLIKEATSHPDLDQYSVVMVDEAHERSIHTDLCFGLLKRICKARPEFRVIISSATLDEEPLVEYFNNAPVFEVPGRAFPVELVYEPKPTGMCLNGVVDVVLKICQAESQGDILVFLAGMDDIGEVRNKLTSKLSNASSVTDDSPKPMIIDCHASLPFEEQQKIFEKTPMGFRKIILATNIAETTLTIEGMDFVVDCGYFKQSHFDPYSQMVCLIKQHITQFQAIQRAGRAGRTRPGKCYRLYSEESMNSFKSSPIPEIQRYNVQYVILDIIAVGFPDPLTFEYMTPPPSSTVNEAISFLKELSALDNETGRITQMGKIMGQFPVEPQLAKVLVMSVEMGCCTEILKIAAMLCTQYMNIFQRQQSGNTPRSDPRVGNFTADSNGDHLTLLRIYTGWEASGLSEQWCKDNLIEHRFLEEAKDILGQLKEILTGNGLDVSRREEGGGSMKEKILKAFTTGYFRQVAKKCDRGFAYQILSTESGVRCQQVFLHPSSALFKKSPTPQWVIFHEILKTNKAYMRGTSEIQLNWALDYAPGFIAKCGVNI